MAYVLKVVKYLYVNKNIFLLLLLKFFDEYVVFLTAMIIFYSNHTMIILFLNNILYNNKNKLKIEKSAILWFLN